MLKKTQIINFVLNQPDAQIRRKDLIHFICNLNGVNYDPVRCRGYYSVALQDTESWWRRGGFLMFSSKKEPRHLYKVRRGVYGVKDELGNVFGQNYTPYDSATSADFRTPKMKNEQAVYDLNKSVKKLAEEEDNYLEDRWDEAHEDFVHLRKNITKEKIEELQKNDKFKAFKKPTAIESNVPRPIVTFGLLGDEYYIGLTTPKGDTMWTKLDTVLNFNNNC